MSGKALGSQAVEQLQKMYQRTAHLKPGQSADTRKEKIRVNRRQGQLTEDLASPFAVIGADPTTARFEFLTEGADGQLHPTGIFNVVTNHDPGVSGSNGDYVIVQRTDGLWMLSSSGSSGGGSSCDCCQCICEEPMRLTWDRDAPFAIDLTGEYPRYRIRKNGQKSKRAQLAPMIPDFIEFLMRRKERDGFVFNPIGRYGRFTSDGVGKAVSAIGEEAGIVTDEEEGRHATCHDFRRSFGDRWARRLMPADLKELMRHKSIETAMKYYVGRDVDDITARLYGLVEVQSDENPTQNQLGNM
ncbi:MAG: site-specific integrase [Planctomycetaceae bacterium]|nr:site-specific integrase [Planctomycetaceae bacterium]